MSNFFLGKKTKKVEESDDFCSPSFKDLKSQQNSETTIGTSFFKEMDATIEQKIQEQSTAMSMSEFFNRQPESLIESSINAYLENNWENSALLNLVNIANQELVNGTLDVHKSISKFTPANLMGYLFAYIYSGLQEHATAVEQENYSLHESCIQKEHTCTKLKSEIADTEQQLTILKDKQNELNENLAHYKEFYNTHQDCITKEVHAEALKQLEMYTNYVAPEVYEETKLALEKAQIALNSKAPTVPLEKYEELKAEFNKIKEECSEELIDTLTEEKSAKDTIISSLNIQITTLNAEKLKLQQKLKTFSSQDKLIEGFKNEIKALMDVVDQNSSEILALTGDNADLKVSLENTKTALEIARTINKKDAAKAPNKDTIFKLMFTAQKVLLILSNAQYKSLLPKNLEILSKLIDIEPSIPNVQNYAKDKEIEQFVLKELTNLQKGSEA